MLIKILPFLARLRPIIIFIMLLLVVRELLERKSLRKQPPLRLTQSEIALIALLRDAPSHKMAA
ncbi:MAG: hypothetical protein BroJett011_42800 [Chloroflexota bacterium]|nr:MAG: hypothetical protein BroJett011_42800 [Chloroflexota bacterium]